MRCNCQPGVGLIRLLLLQLFPEEPLEPPEPEEPFESFELGEAPLGSPLEPLPFGSVPVEMLLPYAVLPGLRFPSSSPHAISATLVSVAKR